MNKKRKTSRDYIYAQVPLQVETRQRLKAWQATNNFRTYDAAINELLNLSVSLSQGGILAEKAA